MLTPTVLELEEEIARLTNALALEAKMRYAAAEIAHQRGVLLYDACALLDEAIKDLRSAYTEEARRIISLAGWR